MVTKTWTPAGPENDLRYGVVKVAYAGSDVFEGRFTSPLQIDLSGIAAACAACLPDAEGSAGVSRLKLLADIPKLTAQFTINGVTEIVERVIIPGGVSSQNFAVYAAENTDAFDSRFLASTGNFFLTTRTSGWQILIPETELYPLFFLASSAFTLVVQDAVSGYQRSISIIAGFWSLDINGMRRWFMEQHGVLPSVFNIIRAGKTACQIVVTRQEAAPERYRLKFRNSLGVFEVVSLKGALKIQPSLGDEDSSYREFNQVTRQWAARRQRPVRTMVFTIESGICIESMRSMEDMVCSDEVYLLDLFDQPVRVIPTVENMSYDALTKQPERFGFKFELADEETMIMPEISGADSSKRPGLFSRQFDKHFN